MIRPLIKDETSRLKEVVLGTAESFGGTPDINETYDPKSKEHILNNTFPVESDLVKEMEEVAEVLSKYDVVVHRPLVIPEYNQIFARDISFVIEDKFIRPHIIEDRACEIKGISPVVQRIDPDKIIIPPNGARLEGGDVMPCGDYIFVGYSEEPDFSNYKVARSNKAGIEFLQEIFPHRRVKGFELNKSDDDPKENALHLDCCFQPVGYDKAIIYKGGFKNEEDYAWLINHYGAENVFEITRDEMYNMFSNVFSISPEVVISERNFTRLNEWMSAQGITVEEVSYGEVAKMEGLLRCSTLPLVREN